ncbi:hypothetical protein MMB17_07580 [Methylobacterium organophilum]|uniref:hypothetical protein n=1 Tax=Methylobacterium organophilum TaxID=410 RepID=UPI001F12957B|nr:hypothetical protein [Methylobacterium organophilum]UMY19151.1 hypothetical protein MMB17_07580 [Methylobacterium organophilum]
MFSTLLEHGKTGAAILGVGGTFLAAYTSLGLPLPASQAFVEAKIATVVTSIDASNSATSKKIDGLAVSTLELQRQAIVQQRARLRFETAANAAVYPKADSVRRVTLERRSAEIQDEMAELERNDEDLRARITKLRQP